MAYRYWASKLKKADLQVYETIVEAIKMKKTDVAYSGNVNLRMIMQCVYDDYPEFFYISHGFEFGQSIFGRKVQFRYLYSGNEIARMQSRIDDEVSKFIEHNITKRMTNYEKELAIYEYLTSEISYDMDAAMSNSLKGYEDAHTIAGVFVKKRAVCDGFSNAFKYLCDAMKVPCIVISGQGQNSVTSGSHAWNMVDVGGGFQHVDVTWDNHLLNGNDIHTYLYLNRNDYDMRKEHSWDEQSYPSCQDANMNYYRVNNSLISTRESMIQYIAEKISIRENKIMFQIDESSRECTNMYNNLEEIIREAMVRSRNVKTKGIRTNILNSSKIIIIQPNYM